MDDFEAFIKHLEALAKKLGYDEAKKQ